MMQITETEIAFQSTDGTKLSGTLRRMPRPRLGVLLVHGITVDRDEDGFYTEFAGRLDALGATSLRFDLRAHGKSGGKYEDLTLSGVINDIDSAYRALSASLPQGSPIVVAASSFGGGLSAYWASERPDSIRGVMLFNPLLDYAKRMIFDKEFWRDGALTEDGIRDLSGDGWLGHGEFRIGRPLLNELFHIRPQEKIKDLEVPLLTIHGDADSMVPYDTAKERTLECAGSEFVTVGGADHGFTRPGDEEFDHPETLRFREVVFERALEWIRKTA